MLKGDDDLQLASRYEKEKAAVSRKGKKQIRNSNDQKLRICLHIKRNERVNFETIGMEVLNQVLPASTVSTWWVTFRRDSWNEKHWNGPEEQLRWPTKKVGRPLLVPQAVMKKVDELIEAFQQKGVPLFGQTIQYVDQDYV
jgi:hypothetical protein